MEKIGIIGSNIQYTLSPKIHQRFAEQSGIKIDYKVIDCQTKEFKKNLDIFFEHDEARGINVTVPFKELAINFSTNIDPLVDKCNSANTLHKIGDKIKAYTTDGTGFVQSIKQLVDIKGKRALIVGAGGAARSVGASLLDHDVIVSYMNRNQNRLETFPDCLRDRIYNGEVVDLVINSTPPIASEYILTKILTEEINLQPNPLFVDLSYKNSLINNQDIKSRFLSSIDGLGMLVFQAALSFKIWFGIEVDPYLVISELVDERD